MAKSVGRRRTEMVARVMKTMEKIKDMRKKYRKGNYIR